MSHFRLVGKSSRIRASSAVSSNRPEAIAGAFQ
jgi:hypothetical protein